MNDTLAQIENAAEIAMEHHLGLTILLPDFNYPALNEMHCAKAVNAAQLALIEEKTNFL